MNERPITVELGGTAEPERQPLSPYHVAKTIGAFDNKLSTNAADSVVERAKRRDSAWPIFQDNLAFGIVAKSTLSSLAVGFLLGIWLDNLLLSYYTWTIAASMAGLLAGLLRARRSVEREKAMSLEEDGFYD